MLYPLISMPGSGGGGATTSSGITDLDRISETTTARNIADSDSGYVIQCSNASAITVTFPDTITAGSWGFIERLSGAGVISWAASGSMVVSPSADSAGHTGSGDAPAIIYWFCDATNSVIVGGDTGPRTSADVVAHASTHQSGGDDEISELVAQPQATWEAGVGTTESVVSPAKVAAAISALASGGSPGGSSGQLQYNNAGAFGGIAGTSWASNQLLMTAQAAATTPLAVRAAASHTANLQEWQNSAGTNQALMTADGRMGLGGDGQPTLPSLYDINNPTTLLSWGGSGGGHQINLYRLGSRVFSVQHGNTVVWSMAHQINASLTRWCGSLTNLTTDQTRNITLDDGNFNLFTNRGATAGITRTITSSVTQPVVYRYKRIASFFFRLDPPSTFSWRRVDGTLETAGKYLELGSDGAYVEFINDYSNNEFIITAESGTITIEP